MATNSQRGGDFYGAVPYRSREGLSTRPVASSDEIQLRIDPMHADLDDEITGLRKHVRQLRNVAQEIESEAKFQNDFINQLQMTLIKAQAGVKNNMRKLNKSIIQQGSSHVMHVILFALFCFCVVYLWSKFSRR
uniref:t-SNARE coiled-coil homology domain-containing protein n=1 Tax=Davidia involucrata TaxID=16924 RepID=A0A5B6YMW9_DAVIN